MTLTGEVTPHNLSRALICFSILILPPSAEKAEPRIAVFDDGLRLSLKSMMFCGETVGW